MSYSYLSPAEARAKEEEKLSNSKKKYAFATLGIFLILWMSRACYNDRTWRKDAQLLRRSGWISVFDDREKVESLINANTYFIEDINKSFGSYPVWDVYLWVNSNWELIWVLDIRVLKQDSVEINEENKLR